MNICQQFADFKIKAIHAVGNSFCLCMKCKDTFLYSVHQRICISDRKHSTPLRLPTMCLTKPLPAGRIHRVHHSNYLTD